MLSHLIKRRTLWWPPLISWVLLLAVLAGGCALWWFKGEAFLSCSDRQPAEVLVVEGWVGVEGVRAAQQEYAQGGYQYIVVTGGLTGKRWTERRWSQVEVAAIELGRMHVPSDRIITAPTLEAEEQRTFATAISAKQTLQARGIQPVSINVFSLGAHARRSRLIHAKVFGSGTKVGVVAWLPKGYGTGPWWRSSERADTLLKETAGYWFELLLNSGRMSNGGRETGAEARRPTPS
jgi:hypothetical protein